MRTRRSANRSRQNIITPLRAIALSVGVAFGGVSSAAYIINGGSAVSEATITAGLQSVYQFVLDQYADVTAYFDTQMLAMDSAIGASLQMEQEQVNSAMKVYVKQMSVSGNLLAENTVKTSQTEVAVEQARLQKDRLIAIQERKGPQGQAFKVCTVQAEREVIAKTVTENQKQIPSLVSQTVYASPGAYGNPHEVMEKMNAINQGKYCTPAQAASGFCSSDTPYSGWSMQMSTLFTPTTSGSEVYSAQNALINNMIGLPDPEVPKAQQGSARASAYLQAKQRKEAIVSPAINSLKAIQSEYAGIGSADSPDKISPIKAIDDQVKRYLGSGEEYREWNQKLTSSSESGLFKEILQIQALDLYLSMRQYQQYEREELLLAGIVASSQANNKRSLGSSGYSGAESDRSKAASREFKAKISKSLL